MKTKQEGYSFSIEGVREMSYCSSLNIPMFFCLYEFINTLSNSTLTISNGKERINNWNATALIVGNPVTRTNSYVPLVACYSVRGSAPVLSKFV